MLHHRLGKDHVDALPIEQRPIVPRCDVLDPGNAVLSGAPFIFFFQTLSDLGDPLRTKRVLEQFLRQQCVWKGIVLQQRIYERKLCFIRDRSTLRKQSQKFFEDFEIVFSIRMRFGIKSVIGLNSR